MYYTKILYYMPVARSAQPVYGARSAEFTFWQGRKYVRYPLSSSQYDRDYFKTGTHPRRALHRDVWEHCHDKPIPPRYDCHHRDDNTLNNALDNLQPLTKSKHMSITHAGKRMPPAAIARMREAQRRYWLSLQPKALECVVCGQPFTAKSPKARLCSNQCACRLAYRKRRGPRFKGIAGRKASRPFIGEIEA